MHMLFCTAWRLDLMFIENWIELKRILIKSVTMGKLNRNLKKVKYTIMLVSLRLDKEQPLYMQQG